MRRPACCAWRAWAAALVVSSGWMAAGCHEAGDVKVTSLAFRGTHAVTDTQLKAVLATKASGWLPWAPKQYFNRAEFEADLGRIRRYYDDRGFPDAKITGVDIALNDTRDAVALTIALDEGAPVVVDDVRYTGVEVLDASVRAPLERPALAPGAPRDRDKLTASKQLAVDLLRDHGYAYADVRITDTPGAEPRHVRISIDASPGPATTFGDITIVGRSTLTDRVVRRQLMIAPGQPYQYNRVLQSQRRLAGLAIIRFVNVDAQPPEGSRPTAIPVTVTLAENPPRRLSAGVGYGSEDRARGSIDWSHLNFLGNARTFTANGKYSSIDRGAQVSLAQPYLYHRGLSLDATVSSWWTNESTYDSHTYGGRVGVTWRLGGLGRGRARASGATLRAGYVHEYLRYVIDPAAQDDLSNFETRIALGFDPVTGEGRGTRAGFDADLQRTTADNALDPHRGYQASLHVATFRPSLGGTFRYDEVVGEGRVYLPIGDTVVLAGRAHYGSLLAASDADVPFSQRYFLGGSTTLRGWGRYQVAPQQNGLPIGGRTVLDATAELRATIRGPLGGVVFVDAGNVWPGNWAADLGDLRTDAGVGLRYATPIGLIRADLGVQLNRYPFLLINGKEEVRHYRLHFSIGQSF